MNDLWNTFFQFSSSGKTVIPKKTKKKKKKKKFGVTLKKHTPLKKRYVRGSKTPFINKTITKEIIASLGHVSETNS